MELRSLSYFAIIRC